MIAAAKVDPASPWSALSNAISATQAGFIAIGMNNVTFSGADSQAIFAAASACRLDFRGRNLGLDGAVFAVSGAGGVVTISQQAITLSNGAALRDSGTVGTDSLQN